MPNKSDVTGHYFARRELKKTDKCENHAGAVAKTERQAQEPVVCLVIADDYVLFESQKTTREPIDSTFSIAILLVRRLL